MEKFTFFWSGPFSQWFRSKFSVGAMTFNCAEQFMMYKKAMMFKDIEIARKIMKSTNPKEHKALGRKVNNFNPKKWADESFEIVKEGNRTKFMQNPHLSKILQDTANTTLVEASPYDKIWGIGLREDDPRAKDKNQWQGKNLLGYALTEVRLELFGE